MTREGVSLSSCEKGIDVTDAAFEACVRAADILEIAVGPKPEPGALAYFEHNLVAWELRAHHTVPLDKVYRPTPKNEALVDVLAKTGVRVYSVHLPAWGDAKKKWDYLDWYRDKLGEHGIEFAVETMYPPLRDDIRLNRSYDLVQYWEIDDFLRRADQRGWKRPLVIDLAHLNITAHTMETVTREFGKWVDELIDAHVAIEYHYSGNDGTRDNHEPLEVLQHPRIYRWLLNAAVDDGAVLIDEGRRR